MSSQPSPSSDRQQALLKIIKTLTSFPAQTVFYGSALLAVAATGGIALPGLLDTLAATVGVNVLSSILERVARGEDVPEDEIRRAVEEAIRESGIDKLVTSHEFQRAIAHVFRQFDLVKYAVQKGEYTIVAMLSKQFTQYKEMMDELQGELSIVRGQMETLATREQSAEILATVQQIAEQLETQLPANPAEITAGIRRLCIFVASPSDVNNERDRLRKVADEFNEPGGLAEQHNVTIQVLGWEQAVSGMGLAEDVILGQLLVEQWDIFVGILWTRFGSPTGNRDTLTGLPFDSGTQEEFALGYRAWKETGRPHILFYRRTAPPASMDDIDPTQYGKVRSFLDQFKTTSGNPGLFTSYALPEEFERRIRQDITKLLPRILEHRQAKKPSTAPAPAQADDYSETQLGYLDWVQRVHSRLELRGIKVQGQLPTVPLDRVFVALKGDRADPGETTQSRMLLDDNLREWEERPEWRHRSKEDKRWIRWYVLAGSPYMPSMVERDRPSVLGERKVEILNLAEAFRRYRWLVTLGDPGSGKTTIARWMALHLAQAYARGEKRVIVPANHVDPNVPETAAPVDLGPARFPLLLRVSDFAEARKTNNNLQLIDYLGFHPWLGEKPTYGKKHPRQGEAISAEQLNKLIRKLLRAKQVVVILDGLDEITRGTERENIVRAIEKFIQDWVNAPDGSNPFDELDQPWLWRAGADAPAESGGNQLVVTSRIAGYHAYPLNGRLVHFTVEPMGNPAIDRFCETWTQAVHQLTTRSGESDGEIGNRATRQAEALKAAIHDPARPSVEEMASNPLLLTILALVHHNTQARLPEQRVRLYQIAIENLVDVWRETDLTEDEVVNILAPVAAHIHSKYSTGLIPEPELRELITAPLAVYNGLDPETLPASFNQTVDKFLNTVHQQVGILAARSEYLYGFLHLTFQEYLAARYLVRDPEKTLERIQEKTGDPRWREPILLALGFAMLNWGVEARERLLQSLLDASDPLADLLPRSPLLVATALPEFVHMPSRIVSQVAQRLLIAYADRAGIGRFDYLHDQIEKALVRLHRGNAIAAFDQVLLDALNAPADGSSQINLAAASLIQRFEWQTPALAEALLNILPFENEEWDWPVTRALQKIAANNPAMLPTRRIPFRQTLSQNGVRAVIQQQPDWQRVLLFLCGGLDREGSFDPEAVYLQPALANQLEDALRRKLAPPELATLFLESWADPQISPAQAGECIIGLTALGEEILPLLQTAIDRPSHVEQAQRMLARLVKTQGDMRDIHVVEQVLAASIPIAAQYPELIGQALETVRQLPESVKNKFGLESSPRASVLSALAGHLPPELIEQALDAARQIRDEDARASTIGILAACLPSTLKVKVLEQALDAMRQLPEIMKNDDYFGWERSYPRAKALSALAAHLPPELMGQALEAARQIQDEKARTRVLSALAAHLPPGLMGQALEVARQIQNEEARASALGDLAKYLPTELKMEALGQALEVARQTQEETSRASALVALAEYLPSGLMGQALEAARQIQDEGDRTRVLSALAAHLPPELIGQALDAARQIQDEDARVQALIGLISYLPTKSRTKLAAEAASIVLPRIEDSGSSDDPILSALSIESLKKVIHIAKNLEDNAKRFSILIFLLPYLPAELKFETLALALENFKQQDQDNEESAISSILHILPVDLRLQALEAARQIQDEEARASALGDLAAYLPSELMGQALEAARQIQNEEARARALGALAAHLPPELMGQALEAARQIQNENARARALGALAAHLPPELIGQALEAARQIQDEDARANTLIVLVKPLGEIPVLWKGFWAQLRIDLLRSRPYRLAENALTLLRPALPWDMALEPDHRDQALLQITQTARDSNNLTLTGQAFQVLQLDLDDNNAERVCVILRLGTLPAFDNDFSLPPLSSLLSSSLSPTLPSWLFAQNDDFSQSPSLAPPSDSDDLNSDDVFPQLPPLPSLSSGLDDAGSNDANSLSWLFAQDNDSSQSPSFAPPSDSDDLNSDDVFPRLAPLPPLSSGPDDANSLSTNSDNGLEINGQNTGLPKEWLAHPNQEIRRLAILLKAEAGDFKSQDIPVLVGILCGDDDRSRYRAASVFLKARSVAKLGKEFIEELVSQALETERQPQVHTVLYWSVTYIRHDDVAMLTDWLVHMEQDKIASATVEWAVKVEQKSWQALFDFAQEQANEKQLETLLDSIHQILREKKVPNDSIASLRIWLWQLTKQNRLPTSLQALGCLEYLPAVTDEDLEWLKKAILTSPEVLVVGGHALARLSSFGSRTQREEGARWLETQAQNTVDREQRACFAGAWLRQQVLSTQIKPEYFPAMDCLAQLSSMTGNQEETMLDAMLYAGSDAHPWDDYHERILRVIEMLATERLLPHFMQQFTQGLAHQEWHRRRIVLAAAAVIAERMPAAFARQSGSATLEQDLISGMGDVGSFNARRFAFNTLSHLPRVSVAVMQALRLAMRDVEKVQQDALQAVLRFRQVDGDLTNALAETLFDPSAAVAYAGAQILEALGRSEMTPPEQRQGILLALASAIRDPRSKREVYLSEGSKIRYVGQLDQVFHRALVAIAEGTRG